MRDASDRLVDCPGNHGRGYRTSCFGELLEHFDAKRVQVGLRDTFPVHSVTVRPFQVMTASIFGLPAEDWSALAAWSTVALALVAGMIAYRQLAEARRVREEQSQPYVVVYAEESGAGPFILDLLIKNFGTTAATDVRLEATPKLQRGRGTEVEDVIIPKVIPVLVPGQEWRTLWDSTITRSQSTLPRQHEVMVRFSDSQRKRHFEYPMVLDWEPHLSRHVVTVRGTHHAAEALREISKTMKAWRESASGGLKVYTRDGDERDKRVREHHEERRRAMEADASGDNDA